MRQLFAILLLCLCGCAKPSDRPVPPEHPQRVISLAPSVTEAVFAIGAGDRLVGDTEWCNYPEAAKSIPRIGGYMTLNAEQVLAVHPDAALMLSEHEPLRTKAEALGVPVVMLSNKSVTDILTSIKTLGVLLEHEDEAHALLNKIEQEIADIRLQSEGAKKPRVLLTVGRNMGSQGIDSVFCVGLPPMHNELIEIAGGVNACQVNQPYPKISAEGILAMNPDIIIDLMDENATQADIEKAKQDWMQHKQIRAVQNNQIHVLTGDYTVVPGPRFILLLKDFAQIIQGAHEL